MNNNLLSTKQAANLMGVSQTAIIKRIRRGTLRALRLGREYIVDRNDLDESYKRHGRGPGKPK